MLLVILENTFAMHGPMNVKFWTKLDKSPQIQLFWVIKQLCLFGTKIPQFTTSLFNPMYWYQNALLYFHRCFQKKGDMLPEKSRSMDIRFPKWQLSTVRFRFHVKTDVVCLQRSVSLNALKRKFTEEEWFSLTPPERKFHGAWMWRVTREDDYHVEKF